VILGCGVDLIEVGRIGRELTRRGGDPLDDIFAPEELAWCRRCRRPAEAYALGFAAKEALVKALGTGLTGRMAWTDIQIDWSGATPAVRLRGETAAAAGARGVTGVYLTVALWRRARPRREITPGLISGSPQITPGVISQGAALAAAWVVLAGDAERAPVRESQASEIWSGR